MLQLQDAHGNTYLHRFLLQGSSFGPASDDDAASHVRQLLQRGCNANAVNNYHQTPLHIAARMRMLPIVIMLLEHGGNPLLRQNDGRSIIDIIGSRCIQADPQLQCAVDDAILRLDTRWGGADAADAAAATAASHSYMKRQHNQFRAMLQDKRRTVAMQQQLLSKRLGPADATQPKPPPSPEPPPTVVPPLDALADIINHQQTAVTRHTAFLNDLHARCHALTLTSASCLRGLPIVFQLLQALENGREARARAQRSAELAALRASERQEAAQQAPPQMEEFIRLTQLLRCVQCNEAFTQRRNHDRACRYHPKAAVTASDWSVVHPCCGRSHRAAGCSWGWHRFDG